MSFPNFPAFRKLAPEDRAAYTATYQEVEPYSDFSFNNLIIWLDIYHDLEISQYGRCVVLRFTNPFEHRWRETAYTLIGKEGCLGAVEAVFDLQQANGQEARLIMVPECVINDMLQTRYLPQSLVIYASQDHCDYTFDVAEVVQAKGGHYEQLRRNLRIFARENPGEVESKTCDLRNPDTQQYLLATMKLWQQDKGFIKNDPTFDEEKALHQYFDFSQWCPAQCRCFYLDGELFGFSILHKPPQQGWMIFNHLKCSRDFPHSYDYIYYDTLCRLDKQGITNINFEQDLGIPGLRVHKNQLGRHDFLYRYNISRR